MKSIGWIKHDLVLLREQILNCYYVHAALLNCILLVFVRISAFFIRLWMHITVDSSIIIHEKGVASFDSAGHDWALRHFENTLGATVIR